MVDDSLLDRSELARDASELIKRDLERESSVNGKERASGGGEKLTRDELACVVSKLTRLKESCRDEDGRELYRVDGRQKMESEKVKVKCQGHALRVREVRLKHIVESETTTIALPLPPSSWLHISRVLYKTP